MLKKSKGFTLVELIIVIVIIGILAAVTVVGYTSQTAKARNNSAYISLTEAVKGANVCIATGEGTGLTPYANRAALIVTTDKPVCSSATSVSANWPTLTGFGGGWQYFDFTATIPYTGAATANVITSSAVTIMGVNGSGAANAPAIGDPAVKCGLTGCTKTGSGF